uniref:Cytochrome P450 n=1 Tax=Kalanchoe fedtschenkoi TaxID=63787 RepID=A0A7N0VFI4_KALFE
MTEGKGATNDLLGLLLESNLNAMKENKHEKDVGMSLEDVTEECKLFYFAGQETTSSLLVWTMILLSQYQGWQKRARDEVLQEDVIRNLKLPAGVRVTVPILSIQRDPKLWGEDANEFKPDRFSEGASNATKGQVKFIPFSFLLTLMLLTQESLSNHSM